MDRPMCPHCNTTIDSGRMTGVPDPKHAVVVMPCPSCSALVVMFRLKALALDRSILERGSQQERKMHIAGIIAEFLEPGLLKFASGTADFEPEPASGDSTAKAEQAPALPMITDDEVREFARVNLRRIDDKDYFKRHFG